LVGGIAHDFNNLLAAMMGSVYLARRRVDERDLVLGKLETIQSLGNRAAEMIRQLLAFARKDTVEMKKFSLNLFIKEAYKLVESTIPENIERRFSVCHENLNVIGDTTQLQQVLMNLLVNARDALEGRDRPRIQCSISHYHADDAFMQRHPELKERHLVRLTIQDNGCGIPEEQIDKVFQPFFTTKEVGKGTGLGLAMVYGVAKGHGGTIDLESRVGEGTAVSIYLPLVEGEDEHEVMVSSELAEGKGELILLVDDEPMIRNMTRDVLESLGYQVIEAENGEEAIDQFRENRDRINLVLSDLVMPKMGGLDAARWMRGLKPGVPVIFMTGYDKEHALASGDSLDNSLIIAKPFSLEELSQYVHSLVAC
jgi:CheY-like chemotaxis protein